MSNEEMNKRIEFIVESQAKFAFDMKVMREVQATDSKLLKDAVLTVVGLVGTLARTQSAADDRITELTHAQAHTDDRINVLVQMQAQAQTRTDEGIRVLMESQARTDERLNIFINVVERHISGNGDSESHP
jgi:hypothetical protein